MSFSRLVTVSRQVPAPGSVRSLLVELRGSTGHRDPDLTAEAPTVSASSSWPRSRPSSWVRVKSLGTAMIAVLSCRVTGSLARSQARWLGCRSSTTAPPGNVEVRGALLHAGSRLASGGRALVARPMLAVVVVQPSGTGASTEAASVSTTLSTGCEPDPSSVERVGPRRTVTARGSLFPQVRGRMPGKWRTSHSLLIHRGSGVWGNLGRPERNKPRQRGARRHPQGWGEGLRRRFDPVERQRVPLAGHPVSTGAACPCSCALVGGRCQPKGAGGTLRSEALPIRRRGCPVTPWREAREQAYVPAEQPPPSQGARVPPAHAHPRRPRHPVLASSQGPQEPGRLRACPPSAGRPPCSAPPIDCVTPIPFGTRFVGGAAPVHGPSWSTCSTPDSRSGSTEPVAPPARVGFVVSKAVGNAVDPQPREAPPSTPGPGARHVAPGLCRARGPGAAEAASCLLRRARPPTSSVAWDGCVVA